MVARDHNRPINGLNREANLGMAARGLQRCARPNDATEGFITSLR